MNISNQRLLTKSEAMKKMFQNNEVIKPKNSQLSLKAIRLPPSIKRKGFKNIFKIL